ncbi:MAG: patatin-like phospholipase family protein [Clostridia bacterium]|nr:patatin-like phospholipase family protein [Clostridia bacterium]
MEKKIDLSKTYAIALGGGGAKGAYEVGVWRSLEEEGLKYNAVCGTSVGALNGALMAMRAPDKAEELWSNIRFSDVMDVDNTLMSRIFSRDISTTGLVSTVRRAVNVLRDGGFDVTPLRELLKRTVDTKAIKASDVAFYIVTYSLTDRKELDIDVRSLPDEEICDMLLASAYFPAFKNEPLVGGKRFTDGGISDSLPVTPLIENGYNDIIAVRLKGSIGREKRVRIPEGTNVSYIEPTRKLGNTLNFSSSQASFNLQLGYYDAKRFVYGLEGEHYYIERTMTEREAYDELIPMIEKQAAHAGKEYSLRELHEVYIPKFAKNHNASGDYYDILIKYLEHSGVVFHIPEFRILTDRELLNEVTAAVLKEQGSGA